MHRRFSVLQTGINLKYLLALFPVIFLTVSCKKTPQSLIKGTWLTQSVTFNGIENVGNPILHGVTQYDIDFGLLFCESCGEYGTMNAKTNDNNTLLTIPFKLTADGDSFQVLCSYTPGENQSGSYLPYMIDSSFSFCGKEAWEIIQLDKHTFISQLIYNSNIYRVELTR